MSLPPQVLKIKRKRIDDPVDSLFLGPHDAQQQSKRRTTEHSYVFRRLSITQEVQRPAPAQPSGIPLIRTTLPGEENRYFDKVARHTRNQEMAAGEVTETRTATEPSDTTHAEERSPVIPIRLFRLARIGLDAHAAQLESPGARQPIFVEKPTSETKDRDLRSGVNSAVSGVKPTRDEEPITLQKRPSGHAPNFGHKRKDMQREEEKPDIEMEEAMRQMAADLELEQQSQVVNQVQSAQVDMNMTDVTDEANYVYDTYIRDEVPRIVGSTSMDTMTGSRDKGGVGYLVIEDGDQDLWETYVERSDESDPDWDSEQDDENAENFYGADYPEDEVDHDDEYNRQAYKYRQKGAADDEEFDSDSDVWSDDGEVKDTSWNEKSWRNLNEIVGSDEDSNNDERLASVV